MKEIDTDVLIIGSGLVGLVAAHSLSSLKLRITIIDKKNIFEPKLFYNDTRTVAVSEGSKQFLEKMSLWNYLQPYSEPINSIKVFDRSSKNKILFKNKIKNQSLGYVIENKKFSQILSNKLKVLKSISTIFGQSVNKIILDQKRAVAYLKNYKINAKLIIAADGKNSDTKKLVGNKTFKKTYPENALVLNISHTKNLIGTAYEVFLSSGPLAILPMKSKGQHFKSTIIWSNKPDFIIKLKKSNQKFFLNFLEERIGNLVGEIVKINSTQIFPLSAHINDSFVNKRLIYVGDSAHSIHPIAGQGWNLGVNDVKNLHEVCKKYNQDIGSQRFCDHYNDLSYNKAFQLFQITDKLDWHFKNNSNLYRLLSYTGFKFIENKDLIKNEITKYAMGV